MRLIIEILLMGAAVAIAAYLLPGVTVVNFWTAIVAGSLIALANATIGMILRILTFPINFLTLGLMSFIITVLMVLLVDQLMADFNTQGFFSALLFAAVLALIQMVFSAFRSEKAVYNFNWIQSLFLALEIGFLYFLDASLVAFFTASDLSLAVITKTVRLSIDRKYFPRISTAEALTCELPSFRANSFICSYTDVLSWFERYSITIKAVLRITQFLSLKAVINVFFERLSSFFCRSIITASILSRKSGACSY